MASLPKAVHVLPDDDLIAHSPDEACVCGPRREPLGSAKTRSGLWGYALVHVRLDNHPEAGGDG